MRRFLKIIKWLLILLLILLAFAYYLLATSSGNRQLIKLVNHFTPYSLSYESFTGTLLGQHHWKNLHIQNEEGFDFQIENISIDLVTSQLWRKKIHLKSVEFNNGELHFSSTGREKVGKGGEIISELPQVFLPTIDIDVLRVRELSFYQLEKPLADVKELDAELHAQDNGAQFNLQTQIEQKAKVGKAKLSADVIGKVELKDDYALDVKGTAGLDLPNKVPQTAILTLTGTVLRPNVDIDMQGWLRAKLQGGGYVDLKTQELDLVLNASKIDFDNQKIMAEEGVITLQGSFDDMRLAVQGEVSGKQIPDVDIIGGMGLRPQKMDDIDIRLKTLGGLIRANGEMNYGDGDMDWTLGLTLHDIDAKTYNSELDGQLEANIISTGKQQKDESLQARVSIKQLEGNWQHYPVHGSGDIFLDGERLQVNGLSFDLVGNKLQADGELNVEEADLTVNINAPALKRLYAGLEGTVEGDLLISGTPSNPLIHGDVSWHDLSFAQEGNVLLRTKKGQVSAEGTLQNLDIALQTSAEGANFSELSLQGKMHLTDRALQDIQLDFDVLDGHALLQGEVSFAEQVNWDISGNIRDIEPRYYLPDIDATINADYAVKGGLKNDAVATQVVVKNLNGKWQGQPLKGNVIADVRGQAVVFEELALSIGKNRVDGEGKVSADNLALDLDVDMPLLAQLYPALKGAIKGAVHVNGVVTLPVVKAKLVGTNLAYAESKVAELNVDVNSGLIRGADFNNEITLTDIAFGEQKWQEITLNTKGLFNQHRVQARGSGGEYNADLQVTGGFSDMRTWAGTVSGLQMQVKGQNWQLQKPTQVKLSPKEMLIDDFCLADSFSAFCLIIERKTQNQITRISYDIAQIEPRSFKDFLPENIKIETQLKGNGTVDILGSGALRGDADLHLTPGKIVAQVTDQPPIVLQLQTANLKTGFTGKNSQSKLTVDFTDTGHIDADIALSDLTNIPKINGNLNIAIPNIGKFQYLIPKIAGLSGQLAGDLVFAGSLKEPQVSGEITLSGGALNVPEYATELKDIRLRISAQRDGNIGIKGNIGTPKGNLTANGVLRLQPLDLDLQLRGKNMLLANAKVMKLVVTPTFDIRIDPQRGVIIHGDVFIPEAGISIPNRRNAVAISDDVVIVSNQSKDTSYVEPNITPVHADIKVHLGDKVFFKNSNMSIQLIGGLLATMRPGKIIIGKGRIEVASGVYELYGQELDIKRGWVTFSGDVSNPTVDILALREVDDVKAGAQVSGTARRLRLELTSEPPMPDSAILSYLIFGRPPDSATDSTALLQTAATVGTAGLFPDDLAEKTGLDVFDVGVGGLQAGKYLMEDLYVGMKSNFFTSVTEFLARYQITDRLSVKASASQAYGNAVDLLYEFETD